MVFIYHRERRQFSRLDCINDVSNLSEYVNQITDDNRPKNLNLSFA